MNLFQMSALQLHSVTQATAASWLRKCFRSGIYTFVALLAVVAAGSAQSADWAQSFGGTKLGGVAVNATTVDAMGNRYIVGTSSNDQSNFGGVTLTKLGTADAFVAKYDPSGAVVWVKNFGGNGAQTVGSSVVVDASGNVFLAGYFQVADLTAPPVKLMGPQDAFAIKLDSSGNTLWARSYGGNLTGQTKVTASGMALDAFGNVFLGGYFQGGGLTTPALPQLGTVDAYVFKLDGSGNTLWARNYGGSGASTFASSIAVDTAGTAYLGGYHSGSLSQPALTSIGPVDAFAFKINSAGDTAWARNYGGNGATVKGFGIAVDLAGSAILVGQFAGADLSTPALSKIGLQDAFAIKVDAFGITTWMGNFGGVHATVTGTAIAVDATGNAYLTGSFSGGDLTRPILTQIGLQDAFALKLDPNARAVWAKNFGGSGASAVGSNIAVGTGGTAHLAGAFSGASLTVPAIAIVGSIVEGFSIQLDAGGNAVSASGYWGASDGVDSISSTAVDGAGNVYVAGSLGSDSLAIGNIVLSRSGVSDAFVAKFDAAGTVIWAKHFGGVAATAYFRNIALDVSGNVYVGGDMGGGDLSALALKIVGSYDAIAAKLDASGNVVWARSFAGVRGAAHGTGIAVDGVGGVYLSGSFSSGLSYGTSALPAIGSLDAFAVKLDPVGNTIWARNFGGRGAGVGFNVSTAIDGAGNVYLGGSFRGASLQWPVLTKIGQSDAFALKLDAAGNLLWAKNYGGSGASAQGGSVAVDKIGNIYLGGTLTGANLTSPALKQIGLYDAFAFKLDSTGAALWAKSFGGSAVNANITSMTVDIGGNLYLDGYFSGGDLSSIPLSKIGSTDAFFVKLDAAGNTRWARNYGGTGVYAVGYRMAADAEDNAYIGGYFSGGELSSPALKQPGLSSSAFVLKQSVPDVPVAPTIGVATAGNAGATVEFIAPAIQGGGPITGYAVTSQPAGGIDTQAGSTSTVHTVAGLTNGVTYTFSVKASNVQGASLASSQSNLVSPSKANQTLQYGTAPEVMVGAVGTLSAAGGTGLPVTFTSTTPSVCTVAGSRVTGVAAGACTVAANQAGDAFTNPAAQVLQTFSVAPGRQSIRIVGAPSLIVGGAGSISATGGGSGNPVTFASSTPSICAVDGETVAAIALGNCVVDANQAGNADYLPANQVSQVVAVGQTAVLPVNVVQGWNLLGNGLNRPINVNDLFGGSATVTSVWKWDVSNTSWQFYAPSMDAPTLETYARAKGYAVLNSINPGDGYWLNARLSASLGSQTGPTFTLSNGNLATAWNLVATGIDVSAAELNKSLGATMPSTLLISQ